jgi:hypothetical protein
MQTLAIVGGGPAPVINAVIAAGTIEARKRGLRCSAGARQPRVVDTKPSGVSYLLRLSGPTSH